MKSRSLPFYEFAEGIFEIDEFDCVSVFVIVGEKRALVLDTGTGIGDLRWVIENRITNKPYDVVLTHNHGDHIGGAGFFEEVWIHINDMNWENPDTGPSLEFRKSYAELIREREDKNYSYDEKKDILEWEKKPYAKELTDGQIFDLGGRNVQFFHCPGHTRGECVAIDNKSGILFAGDACNRNFLLQREDGESTSQAAMRAEKALRRIYDKRECYVAVYNSHHDFRGFGSPLAENVLPDLLECLKGLREGTATYLQVPDSLSADGNARMAAVYGQVQISCMNGNINE
ncbi:MAG: MBL fold metallo-hydrolase [Lachnospiraceae bacterium]